MKLLFILLEEGAAEPHADWMSDSLSRGIYIISTVMVVLAVALVIKTYLIKTKVERKYKENAGILVEWERGLSLVKSTDDYDVIMGLHILYAMNLASDRLWDRRILEHLMQNTSQRIRDQAQFIYERLVDSLQSTPSRKASIIIEGSKSVATLAGLEPRHPAHPLPDAEERIGQRTPVNMDSADRPSD